MKLFLFIMSLLGIVFINDVYASDTVVVRILPVADANVLNRSDAVNTNYGSSPRINPMAWTWNNDGHGVGYQRALIRFDLSSVPAGSTIISSDMNLFVDSTGFQQGHSQLTGSNDSYLFKVTEDWDEHTVTWNDRPDADLNDTIFVPASTHRTADFSIDIMSFVEDWLDNSSSNKGLMFQLRTETPYRQLLFGSRENPDTTIRPYLEIVYVKECLRDEKMQLPVLADANVFSRNDKKNTNYGLAPSMNPLAWTWNNDGLGPGAQRSLIKFDYSVLPDEATVSEASLKLYAVSGPILGGGHSTLSGANLSYINALTSDWGEGYVTWNNQPGFTYTGQATIPTSTTQFQDYTIDVTDLVTYGIENTNYGWIIRLSNENPYRQLTFGASEHVDSTKRPVLEVTYSTCPINQNELLRKSATVLDYASLGGSMSVEAFPNPFSDQFVINLPETLMGNAVIEVYSADGRILKSVKSGGEAGVVINMTDAYPGLYVVKVISGNFTETLKVQKK